MSHLYNYIQLYTILSNFAGAMERCRNLLREHYLRILPLTFLISAGFSNSFPLCNLYKRGITPQSLHLPQAHFSLDNLLHIAISLSKTALLIAFIFTSYQKTVSLAILTACAELTEVLRGTDDVRTCLAGV